MNNLDKQYTALLQDILDNGVSKTDRTGTGTISVFGREIRHKMSEGFPLLTTKKMYFKGIGVELLWFLRGDTNIKYLVDNGCNIWNGDAYKNYCKHTSENSPIWNKWMRDNGDGTLSMFDEDEFTNQIKTNKDFAEKWGELGPIYGKQWRDWGGNLSQEINFRREIDGGSSYPQSKRIYNEGIDQISSLINDLKTNPDSRRLIVNAWNVGELDQMVLPPCHYGFQLYTRELTLNERVEVARKTLSKEVFHEYGSISPFTTNMITFWLNYHKIPTRAISLMWNQRSVDTFLGLPFNIASYGLLLEIIGKIVNMVPDELIGTLGDTHLYLNHIEQAKEQIGTLYNIEDRMHWWFENKKPNRDVVDSVDELSYQLKQRYLDNDNVPHSTREPFKLPKLRINTEFWPTESGECGVGPLAADFDFLVKGMLPDDFTIEGYQSHPAIKAPLSN